MHERVHQRPLAAGSAQQIDELLVSLLRVGIGRDGRPEAGLRRLGVAEVVAVPARGAQVEVAREHAIHVVAAHDLLDDAAQRLPGVRERREALEIAHEPLVARVELERAAERLERAARVAELALVHGRLILQEAHALAVGVRELDAHVEERRHLLRRARLPVHGLEHLDDLARELVVLEERLHGRHRARLRRIAIEHLGEGAERAAPIAELLLLERAEAHEQLAPLDGIHGGLDAPFEDLAELRPGLVLHVEPIERRERVGVVGDVLERAAVGLHRAGVVAEVLLGDARQPPVERARHLRLEHRRGPPRERVRRLVPGAELAGQALDVVLRAHVGRVLRERAAIGLEGRLLVAPAELVHLREPAELLALVLGIEGRVGLAGQELGELVPALLRAEQRLEDVRRARAVVLELADAQERLHGGLVARVEPEHLFVGGERARDVVHHALGAPRRRGRGA
ncbi:MAG: hypothetical protein M5U28_12385 [Sandaracinaceae bacterium]|nr:hypothetical protein [Sandaracinaceae bacterium]